MTLKIGQVQKQVQQLVLTQQLQTSLKILQMNHLELREEIQKTLEANPMLELDDSDSRNGSEPEVPEIEEIGARDGANYGLDESEQLMSEFDKNLQERIDSSTQPIRDWEEYIEREESAPTGGTYLGIPDEDEMMSPENRMGTNSSLFDYLLWQIRVGDFSPEEMRAAEELVGNLDERGYLRAEVLEYSDSGREKTVKKEVSLEEIAQLLGLDLEVVESAHKKLMHLDPPGVGARNLKECLIAQAEAFGLDSDSIVIRIINDHLERVSKNQFDVIAKNLGVDIHTVEQAVEVIRSFDPIPGRNINEQEPPSVIPDVVVEKIGDDYRVVVNDENLPRLRINNLYKQILKSKNSSDTEKQYVKDKLEEAVRLIRACQQRPKTIYRVAEIIVREQREFLEKGVDYIRPMSLKEIARELGMHESTISRATSNKYMQTPLGVFRMKIFFKSGISTSSGEQISTDRVRSRIKQIIEAEDKMKPYTDGQIEKILKSEGIDISRRTVAKYREILGIPPRSARRIRK